MPSFLQFTALPFNSLAETLFLAGTTLSGQSATGFQISGNGLTWSFSGRDLTYDDQGNVAEGLIDGWSLRQGPPDGTPGIMTASTNFHTLTPAILTEALARHAGGDATAAVDLISSTWDGEYLSYTTWAGGRFTGSAQGDGIFMGGAAAIARGAAGDDTITLSGWDDRGYGGAGGDRLDGADGNDVLYGNADNDHITGGRHADGLFGGQGDDVLAGGGGNDALAGGSGGDTLWGERGDDSLSGHSGHDRVDGGRGQDWLDGGAGDDTLDGGIGSDTFVIRPWAGDADTIADFRDGIDRIDLRGHGLADEAAALALAADSGGSVVLTLAGGQTLTLLHTTVAALAGDLIL